MEVLDRLKSTPHDQLGADGAERTRQPLAQNPHATAEEPSEQAVPRRARITRGVILRIGPTAGCLACRAVRDGDPGHEAVGHSEACLVRIEKLMKADPELQRRLSLGEEWRLRCSCRLG